MRFALAHESRTGGRPYNQDRLGHWRTPQSLLLALADGMGGHAGGEIAAQAALDALADAFRAQARPRLADPGAFLMGAMSGAHAEIARRGAEAGLGDAPRTTLVACVVQEGRAHWSFIGDSRLYHIREGRVMTRTRDHTAVQKLVDAGRIREEAVAVHPDRNKLLRCLGGNIVPVPEAPASATLAKGDLLLLCSDGLWGPLSPRQLLVGLIGREPARALPELMARAQTHAGRDSDNISALILEWQEDALERAPLHA
jgi:serine/threonine protein phosphatase PrpC